jgi:Zn-dependent alcohol dehydrogenase
VCVRLRFGDVRGRASNRCDFLTRLSPLLSRVHLLHSCSARSADVPFADASILGCAIFTAFGAVRNVAHMQLGESIAVLGTGGVGSNILQIARAIGGQHIIAVDVSDEKLDLARHLGATHTINALKENAVDRIRAITGGRGVDVAFESLGRPETFVQAVNSVADGGRAVMVGIAPVGVTAPIEITRLVRRKIQILGSYGARARTDMPDILRMVERGQIDVSGGISRRFALKDAAEAYALLDGGKILGRAVIDMDL